MLPAARDDLPVVHHDDLVHFWIPEVVNLCIYIYQKIMKEFQQKRVWEWGGGFRAYGMCSAYVYLTVAKKHNMQRDTRREVQTCKFVSRFGATILQTRTQPPASNHTARHRSTERSRHLAKHLERNPVPTDAPPPPPPHHSLPSPRHPQL